MNDANTVWVSAYTPQGYKVGITLAFDGADNLPHASDVDALLSERGYSVAVAGAKAGEELETVTHVVKRLKVNNDNSISPCIGFYHEHTGLQWVLHKEYLDSLDETKALEALTGLNINDIPEYNGDAFPSRNSPTATRFLVQLPQPLQLAVKKVDAVKDDGTPYQKTTSTRLIGLDSTATSTDDTGNGFTVDSAKAFEAKWANQFNRTQLLSILGISKYSEWQGTVADANTRVLEQTN